jgi:hypothetical protein
MVKLRPLAEWGDLMRVAVPADWLLDLKPVAVGEFERRLKAVDFVLLPPCTSLALSLMAVIELHGPVSLHKRGDIKIIRTANHFVETDDLLTALNRLRDPSFLPKSINRPPVESPAPQSGGG